MIQTKVSFRVPAFISVVILWFTTPLLSQFAYVANAISGNVSGYSINVATGALTPLPGSPFHTGGFPDSVAVDPTGKFLYVAISGNNTISGYTIDASTGALTQIPGSPFGAGNNPVSVAVDPTGRFAYAANNGIFDVLGYAIDATTGALTPVPGSPFGAGISPNSVAVDPTGKFAYVTNLTNVGAPPPPGSISGYTINATTGALTPIPGSPFAAGVGPASVVVDPGGRFAYAANYSFDSVPLLPGSISGYTIDASTGALTQIPGSPFAAGRGPWSIAVDSEGKFVYLVNSFDSNVSGYTINSTTGALTPIPGSPFAAGVRSQSVAVEPAGRFAYVANFGNPFNGNGGDVSGYSIDANTGSLTPIPGSPFAAGRGSRSVTTTPLRRSTSIISSLNPSIYGQQVTWTATVTPSGSVTPTGKVQFKWSIYTIGSATLNSSGVATLTRSNLNADTYPLTAVYAGDADNLGSTSTVLNQLVLETTSTATLTSSPNPSTQGQAVSFRAKISSPTVIPTGPVTFTAGKTVLGTAQLSGGKATLTISSLAVGSTKVTATYYGDSNIAKSSASVTQTVQ
jgi:6-phosphogluconolactonase